MAIVYETNKATTTCVWNGATLRKGKRVIRLTDEVFLDPSHRREFTKHLQKMIDTEKIPEPIIKQHTNKLRVLGLCCGMKGWERAFIERGHYVFTVDIDPKMEPDIVADVMDLTIEDLGTDWDVIVVSPPCQGFSIASCMVHWSANEPRVPKSQFADDSLQLVQHIFDLIQDIQPRFWALENPRAMLRKVWKRPTLSTCFASWSGGHLEFRRPKKDTDMWGVFPEDMPWPAPRAWEKASRGTRRGTQAMPFEERGIIPWGLSYTLCIHSEAEILPGMQRPDDKSGIGNRVKGTLEKLLNFMPLFRRNPVMSLMRP